MNLQKTLIATISCLALLVFACHARVALAEKALSSKAELEATATHIVVGQVKAVYSRKERQGDYEYTRYVAEVKAEKVEKGELPAGLIYVRYFDIRWKGPGSPPPGPGGHFKPQLGGKHRFYLARNGYDGYSRGNNDGGLNVVYVNGVQPADD